MKRWIALLTALCVAGCLCFAFVACEKDNTVETGASSVAAVSSEGTASVESEDPGENDVDPIPITDSSYTPQKPASSSVAAPSQKPASSSKVASSQKPASSSKAVSSQKPASSSKAVSSQKPASSSKATSSQKPASSSKATSSQKTGSDGGIDLPIDWF